MDSILFPDWIIFAGFFLFLKIYSPTSLYFDNIAIVLVSIVFAILVGDLIEYENSKYLWIVYVAVFAIFYSIPYWLSGMYGGVIQQLLLLNEQSVQDKRFTNETEALSELASLIFLYYMLESGFLFKPIIELLLDPNVNIKDLTIVEIFDFLVESLGIIIVLASKYIIVLLVITICIGYFDLFFKKASFSMSVAIDVKAIAVIILLSMWLFGDQQYLMHKFMEIMDGR